MIEWFFLGMIIGFIILVLIKNYRDKQMINAAADAAIKDLEMNQEFNKLLIDFYMFKHKDLK